jgi:dephospho-CoA kinase
MIIIGIAGHPSSGKDTAAEYITDKGFVHISCGDILREEMRTLGLNIDRPSIRAFATEQRKKIGAFYPVNIACERINGQNTVVTGFRNLAEVEYIRECYKQDFVLIALQAPLEARYERTLGRNRVGDNISFEEFKIQEEAEKNNNPESHEVDNVLASANYIIENSGIRAELYRKLDVVLEKIQKINS